MKLCILRPLTSSQSTTRRSCILHLLELLEKLPNQANKKHQLLQRKTSKHLYKLNLQHRRLLQPNIRFHLFTILCRYTRRSLSTTMCQFIQLHQPIILNSLTQLHLFITQPHLSTQLLDLHTIQKHQFTILLRQFTTQQCQFITQQLLFTLLLDLPTMQQHQFTMLQHQFTIQQHLFTIQQYQFIIQQHPSTQRLDLLTIQKHKFTMLQLQFIIQPILPRQFTIYLLYMCPPQSIQPQFTMQLQHITQPQRSTQPQCTTLSLSIHYPHMQLILSPSLNKMSSQLQPNLWSSPQQRKNPHLQKKRPQSCQLLRPQRRPPDPPLPPRSNEHTSRWDRPI